MFWMVSQIFHPMHYKNFWFMDSFTLDGDFQQGKSVFSSFLVVNKKPFYIFNFFESSKSTKVF